jgi:hypothetical protein
MTAAAVNTPAGTDAAAQPVTEDDGPLSPWWMRSVLIVMLLGFSGLITITLLAYRNAPPIPAQVVDEQGAAVFSGADVGDGQAVFLKYGSVLGSPLLAIAHLMEVLATRPYTSPLGGW